MLEPCIILSLTGLSLGSFVNACAYRIPRHIGMTQRSFCPSCGHTLAWHQIIPVWSYVGSRGKCRSCHGRIPPMYLIVEIVVALLGVFLFLKYGPTPELLLVVSYAILMLLIAVIDWQHQIIPNRLVVVGLSFGLVLKSLFDPQNLSQSIVESLSAFVFMFCILLLAERFFKKECMGMGDVKLSAIVALFIGFSGFLVAVWCAAVAGLAYVTIISVIRNPQSPSMRFPGFRLPFGAFLAGTSTAVLVWSKELHEFIEYWLLVLA